MKKMMMGLSVVAFALAGAAYAQPGMWSKPDTDGDGAVSRSEAQTHAAQTFARMDANKDGKLDKTDREAHRAERRAAMFERMDSDKNGQISRAEFEAKHQRSPGEGKQGWRGHKRGHRGMGMMSRMADTNKDGAISEAEFTAAALQRFDRTDTNKDGKVTQEERKAARSAMRDHWRQGKGDGQGPGAPGS